MTWQLLTAIGVITFSISILLRRILLHNDKSDPIAYVVVFQGLVGFITLIYAVFHGFQAPNFAQYWWAILFTIILYAVAHIVSANALQRVEASVFSVLFATSVIWIMLISALVFNDRLTAQQLIGVLLIFVSVGILVERKGIIKFDKGILLGLLTGMLFGFATSGWVYVGRHADIPTWTALSFLGPALVVLIAQPKAVFKIPPLLQGSVFVRVLLLGILFSISSLTSLFAYRDGNVSLIAALSQTSIIVTTLLGIIFLREHDKLWQKCLAASICFIAVLLII